MNITKPVLLTLVLILMSSHAYSDQIPQHKEEGFGRVTAARLNSMVEIDFKVVNGELEALNNTLVQVCYKEHCETCTAQGEPVAVSSVILPTVFELNYKCMAAREVHRNPNMSETDLTEIIDSYDVAVTLNESARKYVDLPHFLASASAPPGIGRKLLKVAPGMVFESCVEVILTYRGSDPDAEASVTVVNYLGRSHWTATGT